jgi:hypothetical protein
MKALAGVLAILSSSSFVYGAEREGELRSERASILYMRTKL